MRRRALALGVMVILLVVSAISHVTGDAPAADSAEPCSELPDPRQPPLEETPSYKFVRSEWKVLPVPSWVQTAPHSPVRLEGRVAITNTPAPPIRPAAADSGDSGRVAGLMPPPSDLSPLLQTLEQSERASVPVPETKSRHATYKQLALEHLGRLPQAERRYAVPGTATTAPVQRTADHAGTTETCVDVLLNPQMDVVQTPTGNYAEPWNFPIGNVYFADFAYVSPVHSLYMMDETDGSDQTPADGWDYDQFGQAFQVPSNISRMSVTYQRAYLNANETDAVWSNIWMLDSAGYLVEAPVAYRLIGATGDDPGTWGGRYWELTPSELAQVSGQTVALVFDMVSDRAGSAPGEDFDEVIFLDDAQVTLCYERGPVAAYLPLALRNYGRSSGPTCAPREPDSVAQPGKTAVGVTCGGSFNALDEKDYYSLSLEGASKVRLRLFDLPKDTNWDALIYENASGYPLACQIGTTGDNDKSANCTLSSSKSYFVLVSRGPNKAGGTYGMSVTRR